jgi:hypothetical protein
MVGLDDLSLIGGTIGHNRLDNSDGKILGAFRSDHV